MAANTIARRANRTVARSTRPKAREEITAEDGDAPRYRSRKFRRPSRSRALADAVAESRLGGAWA